MNEMIEKTNDQWLATATLLQSRVKNFRKKIAPVANRPTVFVFVFVI